MKKKGRGSSWRYNPGIARPWLNEGDEESQSNEEYSVEDDAESIEHPSATANENHIGQLSERVHNLGDMGGHESVVTHAPPAAHMQPIQHTSVQPSSAYVPPTFSAPAQYEMPKKIEPAVEVPTQRSYTPPPVHPSEPVKPPQAAAFTPPQNPQVERPNIPLGQTYMPNIPPAPAVPTTQRIAERLAQQRMEGYWQVPPDAGQHTAPPIEEHVVPVVEQHAARVIEKSAAPAVEKVVAPVAEKPVIAPQPAFVSKPFHPETYFTAPVAKVAEPVIEDAAKVPEPVRLQEPAPTPIVEVASAVAQPTEVETPIAPKQEVIATPRYAEPAAPVQERVVSPAPIQERVAESVAHSQATPTHVPSHAPAAPQKDDVATTNEKSDEQQAAQRLAAQQAAVHAAAEARARSEHVAQRVAAQAQQAQQAKEKPREAPSSNLPARITSGSERPSGLMRTLNAFRSALPIVQRLLPLLEGNVAKAVTNLLAPQHNEPPQPPVDLVPVQRGLVEIQKQHRELREQIATQNVSLQRVEDQLAHVATATDRNTREQQELVEEIQLMGKRQSRFSIVALLLLLLSIAANVLLFLLIKHII